MSNRTPNNKCLSVRGLLALAVASAAVLSLPAHAAPGRSTNIAITPDQTRLINLNHDTGTASVFQINAGQGGQKALTKLAEISVGDEPSCVAIHPSNSEAYVTTADGKVSVIALEGAGIHTVVKTIAVQTEPRGCALTPSGNILYVANHTSSTVQAILTSTRTVAATSKANRFDRPYAVAVTDDGDNNTNDSVERVFVTDFFAQAIPALAGGKGRPFDTGNQGIVRSFPVGQLDNVNSTILSPIADAGFAADRTAFCQATAHSNAYCPSPQPADLKNVPQGAFPNQLHAALVRGNRLYLPSIGAAPEPPVSFNVNVQALVQVVNTNTLQQLPANSLNNLNAQIKTEAVPANPVGSLQRLFGNDIVAIDANPAGNKFLVVSRGGNYVLKAGLKSGKLDIGAPDNVVRLRTGHIPTGVVISGDGARAYTNNEVGRSVSVLDLNTNKTVALDLPSTYLPAVGSFEHNRMLGKLVFFTALGVPNNGLAGAAIRSINPFQFRGKQSNDAWSTCASCHPGGLADGVTWVFPDGPRQSIPLDATYSKLSPAHDTRILNWSAVRGSNTDFNNNSRGVQGGTGFADDPTKVFNHGPTQGVSDALDLETLWLQTVRTLAQPQPKSTGDLADGREVFEQNCASCHGGAKWTKSQILYRDNPALKSAGGAPTDPADAADPAGITLAVGGGGQIASFTNHNGATLTYLEAVGSFDATNPLEIKNNAQTAFGADGFNVPSLLGVRYNAPYFHDGSAEKLVDVFKKHTLPGGGTINSKLSAPQRSDLQAFLNALDGRTAAFPFPFP